LLLLLAATEAVAHPTFLDAIYYLNTIRSADSAIIKRSQRLDMMAQWAANILAERDVMSHDYTTIDAKARRYEMLQVDWERASHLMELLGKSRRPPQEKGIIEYFRVSEAHWAGLMDPRVNVAGYGLAQSRTGWWFFVVYLGIAPEV
jgi:hypothetical protein